MQENVDRRRHETQTWDMGIINRKRQTCAFTFFLGDMPVFVFVFLVDIPDLPCFQGLVLV